MVLCHICSRCTKTIRLKSNASTRPDLIMERGEVFEVRCSRCEERHEIESNDVFADPDYKIMLFSLVISGLIIWTFWKEVRAVSLAALIVPSFIFGHELNAVHRFNCYQS